MDTVVPWKALAALIEPHYPKATSAGGRPPVGVERMLRIHCLQLRFDLSDPAVEEALYDSRAMRSVVGIDLGRARVLAGRSPAAPEPAARVVAPVTVPLLGEADPRALSLAVLTLVLAGLDAFNPCAFFVFLFLLSLLVHQRSRGRMLAIGGAFVLVSGLMYFAFMAAWLNVFQLLGSLQWVTVGAGPLAIVLAFVYTMGARKLAEREGRLLKLMSGLMMLGLGALLAIAPDQLNNPAVALALLAVAAGLSWIAARVTRRRGTA